MLWETISFSSWLASQGITPGIEQGENLENVKQFLISSLPQLLCILVGICAAALTRNKSRIPDGFIENFCQAMKKPVLGNLRNFLTWADKAGLEEILPGFSAYIKKSETKKDGWFAQVIRLRNSLVHSNRPNTREILTEAAKVLETVPGFDQFGCFKVSQNEELFWSANDSIFSLEPFLFYKDHNIHFLQEFREPDILVYTQNDKEMLQRFQENWQEWRVIDQALINPTIEDIRRKVERIKKGYTGKEPWWMKHFFKRKRNVFLVESESINGFLANLPDKQNTLVVDLELKGEVMPAEMIANRLGLKNTPANQDIIQWNSWMPGHLFLVLRAEELVSRHFLKVLLWLADLLEEKNSDKLQILTGRSKGHLEKDQELLWDRLPEQLDRIFQKPPRSSASGLSHYLWSTKKKISLLSIFKRG